LKIYVEIISKEKFDILVLDITMPGKSGLEVLNDIKNIQPNTPILILSMHPEEQFAIRALRSGASGYLTKDGAPEELVIAIEKYILEVSTLVNHLLRFWLLTLKKGEKEE